MRSVKKSIIVNLILSAGKTTLIKLITKIYNIEAGEILFDNNSINEYDLECLRKQIGWFGVSHKGKLP